MYSYIYTSFKLTESNSCTVVSPTSWSKNKEITKIVLTLFSRLNVKAGNPRHGKYWLPILGFHEVVLVSVENSFSLEAEVEFLLSCVFFFLFYFIFFLFGVSARMTGSHVHMICEARTVQEYA